MTVGLMPNPPKGKTQRAAGPLLDRCSFWGSSASPLTTQSHRLSPQIRPAWPETEKQPQLTLVNIIYIY